MDPLEDDVHVDTVEERLDKVSYDFTGYIPLEDSLDFANFIKLVEGGNTENKTPPVHLKLMDNIFSDARSLAILCFRGFAKSTLLTLYLPFYLCVYEKLPNFGTVNYILMILDSAESGAKTVRKVMEATWNSSSFLQKYIPGAKFTDAFIELTNLDGHSMAISLLGAQQGIRGKRFTNKTGTHRPELAIMDDLLTDADSKSPTAIASVEDTIYKAVGKALHPKNKKIYIGTVFSQSDPLYKAIGSGVWSTSVYPICEQFPCSEEDFKGAWEDRFPYSTVLREYKDAMKLGRPGDFNGELMNRVMSSEDRLISDSDITWYKSKQVSGNKGAFNFYITTDFATSEKTSSDFSVLSVWAYNNNGDWLLVDGVCKRQLMNKNIDDLFRLVSKWKPQQVGIEVSGQQGGFVSWIQSEMMTRNIYFALASDKNSGAGGIRPTTNKMTRFNIVLPLFKAGKIWLPEDMKTHPLVDEMLQELRFASVSGFKSKHDDAIDTISMLTSMTPWKPSEETYNDETGLWEDDGNDNEVHALDSYVV